MNPIEFRREYVQTPPPPCRHCNGEGFIEDTYRRDSRVQTLVRRCPFGCNVAGYSARVKLAIERAHPVFEDPCQPVERIGTPCKVIPFPRN